MQERKKEVNDPLWKHRLSREWPVRTRSMQHVIGKWIPGKDRIAIFPLRRHPFPGTRSGGTHSVCHRAPAAPESVGLTWQGLEARLPRTRRQCRQPLDTGVCTKTCIRTFASRVALSPSDAFATSCTTWRTSQCCAPQPRCWPNRLSPLSSRPL